MDDSIDFIARKNEEKGFLLACKNEEGFLIGIFY